MKAHPTAMCLSTYVRHWFDNHFPLLPGAAVTTGAVPPLNGGLSVVTSATFQAGGAVWTYTRTVDSETLECAGPLSTSVHVQVSDTLLRCHNTVMYSKFLAGYYAVIISIYVGAEGSWCICSPFQIPLLHAKAYATTHHSTTHHSTNPYT